jgi:hypothetical protein
MSRIAWGSFFVGVAAALLIMWLLKSRKKVA